MVLSGAFELAGDGGCRTLSVFLRAGVLGPAQLLTQCVNNSLIWEQFGESHHFVNVLATDLTTSLPYSARCSFKSSVRRRRPTCQ